MKKIILYLLPLMFFMACPEAKHPDTGQPEVEIIFNLQDPVLQEFSSEADQRVLTVNANISFSAASSEPWCTAQTYPELTSGNLTVSVSEYTGNYSRSAIITITASGNAAPVTVNVIQWGLIPEGPPGTNIKGMVSAGGVGLQGVAVSDGYEMATTDEHGVYYLNSEKKNRLVFISIPGNYYPDVVDNVPQFFKWLQAGVDVTERMDFKLTAVDNNEHVILAIADFHMANRTSDLNQFNTKCLPDFNNVIDNYKTAGKNTYIITLGDLTWDVYWVSNKYDLNNYAALQKSYGTSVFNTIGNHDHDPYYEGDWVAEQTYRSIIGPNWYSINLGQVHYVILDNVRYINTGGTAGTMGNRTSSDILNDDQLDWLKKDLALVADKTAPLVIAMHTPLYSKPSADGTAGFHMSNGQTLASYLSAEGFSNVLFLSGHAHINHRVAHTTQLAEHNLGAVCATWWWTGNTGYAGNHICRDGSPGGYGVYEVNGRNMEWYYKSIGYDRSYQFRTYDRNKIQITAAKYAPNADATYQAMIPSYAGDYFTSSNSNYVFINVWAYEPSWTVEVAEGAVSLPVTRVLTMDPLHIISYNMQRINRNATPTSSFITENTSHMFRVQANKATSTLSIKVTDNFGNVYTEEMARPKELTAGIR